jgi:hypothetical protein
MMENTNSASTHRESSRCAAAYQVGPGQEAFQLALTLVTQEHLTRRALSRCAGGEACWHAESAPNTMEAVGRSPCEPALTG